MHTGGFEWYVDPVPDLELWSRWTAAGAVSGLMHEQGGGKGNGKKSHIFDFPGGTAIWRKFAKFRTQLFPYIYTQAHIAHQVKQLRVTWQSDESDRLILSLLIYIDWFASYATPPSQLLVRFSSHRSMSAGRARLRVNNTIYSLIIAPP